MSERRKRRRWTASDKLRVVLAGLDGRNVSTGLRQRPFEFSVATALNVE